MLVRTMKPFGAAVVFLAVINLLTESSTANVTDATSSQTPDLHKSNTDLTSTPFISNSPTGTVQINLTTVPTVTTEDDPSARTSQKSPITTVSSPTENLIDNTTDAMNNMHVTGSTAPPPHDKMSTATPIKEKHPETTNASFQEHSSIGAKATSESPQVASKEASTRPSAEPKTKPTIDDKDPSNNDNTDKKTSNGDVKKLSATSNKEIKIGASCVAVVIGIFAIVVIYKICQKKPPAPENAEMKASAEKENVTLVSVKTESPNSDTKRTSSNQMEGIEC